MLATNLRVESFPAEELIAAHYMAIDPEVDLVIVRDLPSLLDPEQRTRTDVHVAAIDVLRNLTPFLGEYWRQNHYRNASRHISFYPQKLTHANQKPHFDASRLRTVGYSVSYNASEEDRRFIATRKGVPSTTTKHGFHDGRGIAQLADQLKSLPMPNDDDMEVIHPGDAAFFGAHPHQAIHGAKGHTTDVYLIDWRAKWWI